MDVTKVKQLLTNLGQPLGFSEEEKQSAKKRWEFLMKLEIPTY